MPKFSFNSEKVVINIAKLKEAQAKEEKEQIEVAKGLRSALCGQELWFTGIIGTATTSKQIKRFNLYYASIDECSRVRITFRRMVCQCKEEVYDNFYDSIKKTDDNGNNLSAQVTIYGEFLMGENPIFNVNKIELYKHYREDEPMYMGDFDYEILLKMMSTLNSLKGSKDHEVYSTIQSIGYDYNAYINTFNDYINQKRYSELMTEQISVLNTMFDSIITDCNNINKTIGGFKYDGYKIRKIIEDIAMMHTSIQSESYDQLGVLYDNNCLRAMYEACVVTKSLLVFDNDLIDNKHIILIILAYFRSFYAKYLKSVKLPIKAVPAYQHYSDVVKTMMKELNFDTNKISYVYDRIKDFIYYIRKMME